MPSESIEREREIEYSERFLKQLSRLSQDIVNRAQAKEAIFRADPFDPRLNTHKLHGKDKEAWAFSVTDKYRIKFTFQNGDKVLFLEIGTHDIYK